MNAQLEDWKNGWHGLHLGLSLKEIERLIQLLKALQANPNQHFHASGSHEGPGGLGDIEVYVKDASEPDNLSFSSLALAPGTEVHIKP